METKTQRRGFLGRMAKLGGAFALVSAMPQTAKAVGSESLEVFTTEEDEPSKSLPEGLTAYDPKVQVNLDLTGKTYEHILSMAGVGIVFAVGGKVLTPRALVSTCGWYDTGAYRCTADIGCWMAGSYKTEKRQAYYCNGVPTGAYRWVKAWCGC